MDRVTAQMGRLCSEWDEDRSTDCLIRQMQQMCLQWNEDRNVEMVTAQTGRLSSQWDEDRSTENLTQQMYRLCSEWLYAHTHTHADSMATEAVNYAVEEVHDGNESKVQERRRASKRQQSEIDGGDDDSFELLGPTTKRARLGLSTDEEHRAMICSLGRPPRPPVKAFMPDHFDVEVERPSSESVPTEHESTIHSPSSINHHGDTITERMRQSHSGWFGLSDDENEDDEDNGDSKSAFAYDERSDSLLCYSSDEEDDGVSTASDGDGQLLGLEFEFASGDNSADDEDDSPFADTNMIEYDTEDASPVSSRHFHRPQLTPIDMDLVQRTHRPVYSKEHGCILAEDVSPVSSRHFHRPQLTPIDMDLVQRTHRPVYSKEHGCILAEDTEDVCLDYPPSCDLASLTPIDDAEWATFEARSDEDDDADLRDPGVGVDVEHEDVEVSTKKKCSGKRHRSCCKAPAKVYMTRARTAALEKRTRSGRRY